MQLAPLRKPGIPTGSRAERIEGDGAAGKRLGRFLSCQGRALYHVLVEACLEFAARDSSGDEHDPRSVIGIRPRVQHHRGMEDVVHAVHDHRSVLADQVQDALDAQEIVARAIAQPAKPCRERLP